MNHFINISFSILIIDKGESVGKGRMNELKPCVAMRENQRLLTLAVTTAATAQPTRPSSSDLGMAQRIEPDFRLLRSNLTYIQNYISQVI